MDRYPTKKYESITKGQNTLSYHDDMEKIEKLSMINANARFELLNANEQLLNFQMNRYMKHAKLKKNQNSSQSGSQMLHNNPNGNTQNPVRMPLVHKSININRNNYHA